jgi:hypothetical protein
VYNAKINIHRSGTETILLGMQRDDLKEFTTVRVEALSRDTMATGSFFVRP